MLLLFVVVVLRIRYRRVYLGKFCYLWSVPRGTFIYTRISKPVDAQIIMSIIKIGKHTVEIYDDIESLPVVRYHKYSKMLLVDAGIGSGAGAASEHLAKISAFVRQGKTAEALQGLENLIQSLEFSAAELNPKMLAFAALVKSVDGEPITDITDEGLQKTAKMFDGEPMGDVAHAFAGVKKKIDDSLRLYFPNFFEDSESKEYYDRLRRRVLCQLEAIRNGGANCLNAELDKTTDDVLTFYKPLQYAGSTGMEVRHDKGFESLCVALAENLHIDAKKMSVMEYYNAVEYAQERAKETKTKTRKK